MLAILAAISIAGCRRQTKPTAAGAAPQPTKTAAPIVSLTEQRAALRDAYRLRPDNRFLRAFGEVRRLSAARPAEPAVSAKASFSEDRWVLELDGVSLGSVPELPDFPDYLERLVEYAGKTGPRPSSPSEKRTAGPKQAAFLAPAVLGELRALESGGFSPSSVPNAANAFARISFQMADQLDMAIAIPSRALALLAIVRAGDSHASLEEEVLLAHSLGYTGHAERAAHNLPASSPLRLFEERQDDHLWQLASGPGASEEARYLALRRAVAAGDIGRWKEARERFFPGNSSLSIISTGLALPLLPEAELEQVHNLLVEAAPRAVLREVFGVAPAENEDPEALLDSKLAAATGAPVLLWDREAAAEYVRTASDLPFDPDIRSAYPNRPLPQRLSDILPEQTKAAPDRPGDGRGGPLLAHWATHGVERSAVADEVAVSTLRTLAHRLDTRPEHRAILAKLTHKYLDDPRAAEDLHRSLVKALGDGSLQRKAESSIYVGDWTTLERILGSHELSAQEANAMLDAWYYAQAEPARLARDIQPIIRKFPKDWGITNLDVEILRSRKEFSKACAVLEEWIRQNPDPRTPGFFHARIRLAHGYVLAHEYEKGRALLERTQVSDVILEGFRKRVLAECLEALEKIPDAEQAIRDSISVNGVDTDSPRILARILWAEGKDREAALTLASLLGRAGPSEVCPAFSEDLPRILVRRSPPDFAAALEALAAQPSLATQYKCLADGFARAGRWEDAIHVSEKLPPAGTDPSGRLVTRYGYMKSWKGREEAANWLRMAMPPTMANKVVMDAFVTKDDEVLWDVSVDPMKQHFLVWMTRVVAFTVRGKPDDPRRADLVAFYQKDNTEPFHAAGRYLLGLGTETDLLAGVKTAADASNVAYFLGAKAQSEKRYRDACDWYRVSVENREGGAPRIYALWALHDWVQTTEGIGKLERPTR